MPRARPALLAALVGVAGLALTAPARAALVVFEDGRHIHVTGFEVNDDQVSLSLDGGGRMVLPLDRVDRIVDDEVDHTPPPPPAPSAETPQRPRRSVRSVQRPPALQHTPYDALILAAAKEHRVDPGLIAAVIKAESNFAPRAVSRKGARGLMQLMPATARRLGVRRTFDPRENIRGGAAYLAQLAERYGDTSVELILAAYNAGERAVDEYGGVPPYRETVGYVKRVTDFWNAAHAEGDGS